ncbi:restriction endonuclease subunit S [Nocardioides carbamazepini]|uniref:restriction endonuclease subunit S n=1 Tax=Nocardioides carbamazepini TaxID=2854259 RepID=UPI002149ED08|nr:restriction endonuclease subunit S [Nocardioides carbamazepini]MCR1785606.1 restriction endonuclease subunit S [Nocardioides carbamazepini]
MSAPWLDSMPSTWRQIALQYLATVGTGSKDTVNAVEDGEHPFIVRSAEPLAIDTFTFDTEAILTAGDGAVGEIFHHIKGKFDAHQRVYVIHDFQGIDGRYLYWYFSSEFRRAVSFGGAQTTVASLRRSMFTTFPVTVPPPNVQRLIADFLDRETREIDVMIGKLDGLADQLRTLHRTNLVALGHQLCSPGPSARVGLLLTKRSRAVRPDDGVVTAFRDGQVALRSRRREEGFTMSFSEAGYQGVEPGDFVFHGLDGFAGAVGVSEDRGKVSPVYHVCTATPLASERFMAWALRALAANGFLEAYAFSVRQRSVDFRNWATFAGLPITYTPLEEQVRLADRLDMVTEKIDAMLAKVAELKALLIERRTALITDVVTGRKEVA